MISIFIQRGISDDITSVSTRGIQHDPACSIAFFAIRIFFSYVQLVLVCHTRHESSYTPHLKSLKAISSDSERRIF